MTDLPKLMREWLDIAATGPAEAWPDRAAEDIVIHLPYAPPGVKSELRGMAECLATLGPIWSSKQSFNWRDVAILRTEDPDLLIATARSEVVLGSGRPYANNYVIMTRFRDGKVVDHSEYFNPLLVIEAYGDTFKS